MLQLHMRLYIEHLNGLYSNMKNRIAKIISAVGHPLLTIPLFIMATLFYFKTFENALLISVLIIGGLIIPVSYSMYRKSKNGTYTNFDVSNKTQRQRWYPVPIVLLTILTVVLYLTHQPLSLCYGMLCGLLLLISCGFMNQYSKVSLHTAYSFYIVVLAWQIVGIRISIFFILLAIIIAWSRWVLKQHNILELILGCALGLLFGLLFVFLVKDELVQVGYKKII
jgi:membrane-associated phospholipid phosphatase